MRIYADYSIYLDRQDDDDWPDIWSDGYQRWMRPRDLSLSARQRPDDHAPVVIRAWANCQKRWANSQRLTGPGTWYSATIWQGGPIPEWLAPYVSDALSRIAPIRREEVSPS